MLTNRRELLECRLKSSTKESDVNVKILLLMFDNNFSDILKNSGAGTCQFYLYLSGVFAIGQ